MKLAEITQKCEHAAAAVDKFEQAIAHGLQHMSFNELDTSLLYNYGAAVDFLGDFHNDVSYYEKAVQALAHVVSVDDTHPYAKYNLALALFHRAELTLDFDSFHKAIDILHELSSNDPEDDILWNQYGSMLLTLADLLPRSRIPRYHAQPVLRSQNKAPKSSLLRQCRRPLQSGMPRCPYN